MLGRQLEDSVNVYEFAHIFIHSHLIDKLFALKRVGQSAYAEKLKHLRFVVIFNFYIADLIGCYDILDHEIYGSNNM